MCARTCAPGHIHTQSYKHTRAYARANIKFKEQLTITKARNKERKKRRKQEEDGKKRQGKKLDPKRKILGEKKRRDAQSYLVRGNKVVYYF